MKKKLLVVIPIVIVIVVALLLVRGRPVSADYFVVRERDFVETLVASGRVEPRQRLTLAYQVPGVIGEIYFEVGDIVERGATIIKLDTAREEIQLGLARTEVTLAEAFIQSQSNEIRLQAQEEFRQALINTRTALDNYRQVQSLFEIGGASQQDVQTARDAWEIASSQEAASLSRLRSVQAGGATCVEAMARLEQAHLRVQEAEIAIEQKNLVSPIEGRILSLNKLPGEYVASGESIVTLAHLQGLIVVDIDEKEYPRLRDGLPARVMSQADQSKMGAATVVFVAPAVDPRKGTVEVKLQTDQPEVTSKTDAAVTVEIVLEEQQNLLAFPESFLDGDGNQVFVWALNDERAHKVTLDEMTRWQGWVITTELPLETMILEPQGLRDNRRIRLASERTE